MTASSEFYSLSCGSCGGCRNECSETKEGATQSTACQSIQNPWGPRTEEAGGIGLNERLLRFIREDTDMVSASNGKGIHRRPPNDPRHVEVLGGSWGGPG